MGQTRPLFVYFRFFTRQIKHKCNKMIKVQMVCLGLETREAGWQTQTNPLSYCGTPHLLWGSITEWLTLFGFSCFANVIQKHINFSGLIQTCQMGRQPYSDAPSLEISQCCLIRDFVFVAKCKQDSKVLSYSSNCQAPKCARLYEKN